LRKEAGGGGGDGVTILQQNPVICRRDKVFREKLYYNIITLDWRTSKEFILILTIIERELLI
jgi:hypothetical protein